MTSALGWAEAQYREAVLQIGQVPAVDVREPMTGQRRRPRVRADNLVHVMPPGGIRLSGRRPELVFGRGTGRGRPVRVAVSAARRRAGSGAAGADCGGSRTGAGSAADGPGSRRGCDRGVRGRRHPPIQRSVIAFMRGVWMLQSTVRMSASARTASNTAVKFDPRSRIMNLARCACSSKSIRRLRAC
jgi:hypothetical protein